MGAECPLLETRDEPIRDPLRGSLHDTAGVKWAGAWTLPSPWTHNPRPPRLGKPHKPRFPTAPTRCIVTASHTENLTVPSCGAVPDCATHTAGYRQLP